MATNDTRAVKSPFKFLDAFTLEDRDAFFGRDKEVATLYDYVNKNRLVLVYGQSGTGKTSLVQCGLAGRFDITDWYPISIRRQNNINESLQKALSKLTKKASEGDIIATLERLNARFLRPIYLIFDQFEELLILGDEKEQKNFIQTVTKILSAEALSCHVIFIIREEFIARLYQFEREIPTLFDRRLRIESMNFAKVKEVILKSCDKFNISLEKPEENTKQIIENISAGKSGVALPYLQVYLDMLYREDFVRTYGGNGQGQQNDFPELEFTSQEIEDFGKIEDVLNKFLKEQEDALQRHIEEKHPGIPENIVRKVLDAFVTEEGTKRPIRFTRDEESKYIRLEEKAEELLPVLKPAPLTDCLDALENSRLLRFADDSIELAHDSLAALIDEQRTDEQRQINELKRMVQSAYNTHLSFGGYLSPQQYFGVKNLLPELNLNKELAAFVEASRQHNEALEKAEKERLEKDLATQRELAQQQEQLLVQQKKANRRQRLLSRFMVAIALVAVVTGFMARQQSRIAKQKEQEAIEAKDLAEKEKAAAIESDRQARESASQAEKAREEAEKALEVQRKAQVEAARAQARQLVADNNYQAALLSFANALSLATDKEKLAIQAEINQCRADQVEYRFATLKERGLRLAEADECEAAKFYLEAALKIKPDDNSLINTLNKCQE